MTTVYQEVLPESYLLLLMNSPGNGPNTNLENALQCASSSGKAAVWVDCELVDALPADAVRMLWEYHYLLQEQCMKLVVVHASDQIRQGLLDWQLGPSLCFAPTLFDAAWHTGRRLTV